MLDANHEIELANRANAPDARIFPDDHDSRRFYVVARIPRVSRDETGEPQINLLLYKRAGKIFGGMLTAAVDLALSETERAAVKRILAEHLSRIDDAAKANPGAAAAAPPELSSPDWIDAEAVLRLTRDLEVRGKPSLGGDNQCAFSLNLDEKMASALQQEWHRNLPDAVIEYQTVIHAAGNKTDLKFAEKKQDSQQTTQTAISFSRRDAASFNLNLSGAPDFERLDDRLQIIDL